MPSLTLCRLAYACSGCTLTVEAAKLLQYWSDKLSGPVAILITLAPVILLNLFGPVIVSLDLNRASIRSNPWQWYGRLEWAVKWTKILLILTITVLMIMIAAGGL
jgi:amino acid permease